MQKQHNNPTISIIGAGPSGIAAALQLNLFGLKPLIFERNKIGGLLRNAFQVNNYPGFKNRISGIRLANNFRKQLLINNKVIFEDITLVQFNNNKFTLTTKNNTYDTDYLIAASGTIAKENRIIDVDEKLIFTEISSLLHKKSKKIAIVGAGDAAFDYALSLARKNDVSIFNRGTEIKCNEWLIKRFKKSKTIKYFENYQLNKIEKLTSSLLLNFQEVNECIELSYNYLIFAIGRQSNLFFLQNFKQDEIENLILKNRLHIIGDAANGNMRQTGIAVGDGIKAAMFIFNEINYDNKSENR